MLFLKGNRIFISAIERNLKWFLFDDKIQMHFFSSNLGTRKEFGRAIMFQAHIVIKMYTIVIDGKF